MKLRLIFFLSICLLTYSESQAQLKLKNDSTKSTVPRSLFLFNHYPRFSFESFSQAGYRRSYPRTFLPNTDYREYSLMRLDHKPFYNSTNFNTLSRRDFFYSYDPANPYGAMNPLDGVTQGAIDYLLWKLFDGE